jgi:hypothetical protein
MPVTPKRSDTARQNRVIAMFTEGYVSFGLPRGATLADLAERLPATAPRHRGSPIAIEVRLAG